MRFSFRAEIIQTKVHKRKILNNDSTADDLDISSYCYIPSRFELSPNKFHVVPIVFCSTLSPCKMNKLEKLAMLILLAM
jgi:hypothetical protein